jgi:ribosome-binding ATPase
MGLTAGIVGMPNIGKSMLFNALTKSAALSGNFPFKSADPNIGVVEVPDDRIDALVKMYNPKKTIYTSFEFIDLAGLVKGSSKGEGLGNQFLSHIRNVDAICHVVRCFEDDNIIHVDGSVNPLRDIETIGLELIFADLESIEKRLPKIKKRAGVKSDKEAVEEFELLTKLKGTLEEGMPIRSMVLLEDEAKLIKNFSFITAKPMLYVCNISEDDLADYSDNTHVNAVIELAKKELTPVSVVCAKIEQELASLSKTERLEILEELGVSTPGINDIIAKSYDMLGLATFLTAGEKEVRAWTFKKGAKAPECAGVIHSDIEKGFIKAETIYITDLLAAGSEEKAKQLNKFRLEGKEYIVKDGDVLHFRFNI